MMEHVLQCTSTAWKEYTAVHDERMQAHLISDTEISAIGESLAAQPAASCTIGAQGSPAEMTLVAHDAARSDRSSLEFGANKSTAVTGK